MKISWAVSLANHPTKSFLASSLASTWSRSCLPGHNGEAVTGEVVGVVMFCWSASSRLFCPMDDALPSCTQTSTADKMVKPTKRRAIFKLAGVDNPRRARNVKGYSPMIAFVVLEVRLCVCDFCKHLHSMQKSACAESAKKAAALRLFASRLRAQNDAFRGVGVRFSEKVEERQKSRAERPTRADLKWKWHLGVLSSLVIVPTTRQTFRKEIVGKLVLVFSMFAMNLVLFWFIYKRLLGNLPSGPAIYQTGYFMAMLARKWASGVQLSALPIIRTEQLWLTIPGRPNHYRWSCSFVLARMRSECALDLFLFLSLPRSLFPISLLRDDLNACCTVSTLVRKSPPLFWVPLPRNLLCLFLATPRLLLICYPAFCWVCFSCPQNPTLAS